MNSVKNQIVIKCPACGMRLAFKPVPNYRQKKVTCPSCKHMGTVADFILEYDPSQAQGIINEDEDTRLDTARASILCVNTGEQYPLQNGTNTIGRKVANPKAQITFEDPDKYMSKLHATISVVNAGGRMQLHLRDEDSTNGIFINGKQVPKGSIALLTPGLQFRMGQLTFVCKVPEQDSSRRRKMFIDNEDTQMG